MKAAFRGFLFALIVVSYCQAQKAPAKYGSIDIADLKMNRYEKDTSAAAVVLVDYGESSLEYHQEKGFFLVFERLRRIKILKTEGLDWANFKIMTYHSGSDKEKITSLKATTYNLENGKIVESKMKNESVFEEKYDKNRDVSNLALPNVKVGSVLEISYRLTSDFFMNFQDWEFQSTIPIVWSEYRARIPEYFVYDKYTQGYISFDINEQSTAPSNIVFRSKTRVDNGATQFHEDKIDFNEKRHRWVAKDVPAFKEEPFLTTSNDYIFKINFELARTQFPQQAMKSYMGSWDDINKIYAESADFGGEVSGNGFLKKLVDDITAGLTTPIEKIEAINTYVKNNITWNKSSRSFSISVLKKVVEEKKGNSAEINLILASMLDKAGFSAFPVLSSTRDHGFIRPEIPASTQFNYVLCLVQFDEKEMLLDATEPLLANNTLPERCLNGKGMAVSKAGPRWVEIKSPIKSKSILNASLTLQSDGVLHGNFIIDRLGYDALNQRKQYLTLGESEYVKKFTGSKEWSLSKSEFENVKDLNKQFKEKYDLEINNHLTSAGDIIYINPFIHMQLNENPFRLEKREYPVDFGFAADQIYMLKLTIPEGYSVEEIPQSKIIALPANASRYLYNTNVVGNTITITSSLSINKSLFIQDEYLNLREFYNQVVAKQAEQIVLKKKLN